MRTFLNSTSPIVFVLLCRSIMQSNSPMTQRLHYLLLMLTVLLLGQAVCTAQAPAETAQIELIVALLYLAM